MNHKHLLYKTQTYFTDQLRSMWIDTQANKYAGQTICQRNTSLSRQYTWVIGAHKFKTISVLRATHVLREP